MNLTDKEKDLILSCIENTDIEGFLDHSEELDSLITKLDPPREKLGCWWGSSLWEKHGFKLTHTTKFNRRSFGVNYPVMKVGDKLYNQRQWFFHKCEQYYQIEDNGDVYEFGTLGRELVGHISDLEEI